MQLYSRPLKQLYLSALIVSTQCSTTSLYFAHSCAKHSCPLELKPHPTRTIYIYPYTIGYHLSTLLTQYVIGSIRGNAQ